MSETKYIVIGFTEEMLILAPPALGRDRSRPSRIDVRIARSAIISTQFDRRGTHYELSLVDGRTFSVMLGATVEQRNITAAAFDIETIRPGSVADRLAKRRARRDGAR